MSNAIAGIIVLILLYIGGVSLALGQSAIHEGNAATGLGLAGVIIMLAKISYQLKQDKDC